jgi:predicted nucleic acid-binding protein
MKILIDSDVLLDIALERQAFVDDSEQAVSKALRMRFELYFTSIALANSIYLITKYKSQADAIAFILAVLEFGSVIDANTEAFKNALNNNYRDLEDGIQIEAAKQAKVDLIITRNLRDYQNDQIPVKTPEQYLASFA